MHIVCWPKLHVYTNNSPIILLTMRTKKFKYIPGTIYARTYIRKSDEICISVVFQEIPLTWNRFKLPVIILDVFTDIKNNCVVLRHYCCQIIYLYKVGNGLRTLRTLFVYVLFYFFMTATYSVLYSEFSFLTIL